VQDGQRQHEQHGEGCHGAARDKRQGCARSEQHTAEHGSDELVADEGTGVEATTGAFQLALDDEAGSDRDGLRVGRGGAVDGGPGLGG
jgi:hypothetical protein